MSNNGNIPSGLNKVGNLSENADTVDGTQGNDFIDALGGDDKVSGEAGHDAVFGGAGNDTIYGDKGEGTEYGQDATPLSLEIQNFDSKTYSGSNASEGDSAVYKNVAQLEDGTDVWGRLVLVDKSDPSMKVNLAGGDGYEILLGGTGTGDTASFRFEFFDPATGDPIALNSVATFNDLDANSAGDVEAVTLNASSFKEYATSGDTSLDITQTSESVTATGTEWNNPDDDDAWFSAGFEDRTFIEFSLESRSTQSGFTFSGDLIEDANIVVIEQGDDTLDGGDGDDVIYGQGGDDDIEGGRGDDTLSGGADNDTLSGGSGNDEAAGGSGNDVITGGTGDDTLTGGEGDDVISGDFGTTGLVESEPKFAYEFYELDGESIANLADTGFSSGADNDNPPDGEGAVSGIDVNAIDSFHGGNSDTFAIKLTTNLEVNASGEYTFDMASDDGSKLFVNGVEVIGNDGLHGTISESGTVTLPAGDNLVEIIYFENYGASTLRVDVSGPDTGGASIPLETANVGMSYDDTLEGGAGSDTLTGGIGDDTFVYNEGDGNDTITDFNSGNTGTLSDGDPSNNDFIDLSGYYDNIRELHADQADDGILNQSNTTNAKGDAVDYSDNDQFGSGSITFTGATADASFFTSENTGVVCFDETTLIATPDGPCPVEELSLGNMVLTRDNGPQPVLWIGRTHIDAPTLAAKPALKPIVLSPRLTGGDAPLVVSPQHGLLMGVEQNQTLIRATHLARMTGGGARIARGRKSVTYYHFMLPGHEIVFANGAPAESFYPGAQGVGALPMAARMEIAQLFPDLPKDGAASAYGDTARSFSRWGALPDTLRALVAA